jgi:hypothetical protein
MRIFQAEHLEEHLNVEKRPLEVVGGVVRGSNHLIILSALEGLNSKVHAHLAVRWDPILQARAIRALNELNKSKGWGLWLVDSPTIANFYISPELCLDMPRGYVPRDRVAQILMYVTGEAFTENLVDPKKPEGERKKREEQNGNELAQLLGKSRGVTTVEFNRQTFRKEIASFFGALKEGQMPIGQDQ